MLPAAFRPCRALGRLNDAGVGLALAEAAAAGLTLRDGADLALAAAAPTAVLVALWARLMRWPRRLGGRLRVGWLLAAPLAALDACLATRALLGDGPSDFSGDPWFAAAMGLTVGARDWIPALLGTLVCFGPALAWSHRAARAGLEGEERGERAVALAVATVALGALAALPAVAGSGAVLTHVGALSTAGLACATSVLALGLVRARRRRAFLAAVAAGRVDGVRLATAPEGRTLVRVHAATDGYRAGERGEVVAVVEAPATRVRGS